LGQGAARTLAGKEEESSGKEATQQTPNARRFAAVLGSKKSRQFSPAPAAQ
jgi:hypothetical protein